MPNVKHTERRANNLIKTVLYKKVFISLRENKQLHENISKSIHPIICYLVH